MAQLGESLIGEKKHLSFADRKMTAGEVWTCVHGSRRSRFTRGRLRVTRAGVEAIKADSQVRNECIVVHKSVNYPQSGVKRSSSGDFAHQGVGGVRNGDLCRILGSVSLSVWSYLVEQRSKTHLRTHLCLTFQKGTDNPALSNGEDDSGPQR
jgi:hypothetical protein